MPSYEKDVELARLCEAGDERAWERFILEYRPILYRAADALDPSGGAREIADALYAELYGLGSGTERRSLFRYYHGRSSLGTWLRAVLAQRFVDRHRTARRFSPLPDVEPERPAPPPADPDAGRLQAMLRGALDRAMAALPDRDRLRLAWYYVEQLTLAQIGRALGEHEATVSRHLTRTRRTLRSTVERTLRDDAGLSASEIARAFELAAEDPGTLDLTEQLGVGGDRKKTTPDRSV